MKGVEITREAQRGMENFVVSQIFTSQRKAAVMDDFDWKPETYFITSRKKLMIGQMRTNSRRKIFCQQTYIIAGLPQRPGSLPSKCSSGWCCRIDSTPAIYDKGKPCFYLIILVCFVMDTLWKPEHICSLIIPFLDHVGSISVPFSNYLKQSLL